MGQSPEVSVLQGLATNYTKFATSSLYI